MFTGLVECVGRVVRVEDQPSGRRLVVDAGDWPYQPEPGASVAVEGCCLTHAPTTDASDDEAGNVLCFDVVHQTLQRTTLGDLRTGSRVNLEGCVTPTTRLGGHFVQGHVDGVGRVTRVTTEQGHRVTVSVPSELMPYIVPTGSVAVNGVSLTLAAVDVPGSAFTVALIPTTLEATTFGDLREGDRVNLEVDVLVKSVVHYMQHFAPHAPTDR